MLAVGSAIILVLYADPFGGDDGTRLAASAAPSEEPVKDDGLFEEPVADPSPSPTPTGKRLFEVAAWSRGSRGSLDRAVKAKAIDEVDFDWYHSRADGSVKPEGENLDLLARAKSQGVRVLMTVTNRKNHLSPFDPEMAATILATPEKRKQHIDALMRICLEKGYDGIDLDWEMMKVADRDRFSSFVEELAQRLHAEKKLLSIAVFPKTSEPGEWDSQKSEDYKRIGAAVDEFKIMTYSFSGPWSKPGPQAPLDWADEVLSFAETVVKPSKIAMGVPFFGFEWVGDEANTAYLRDVLKLQQRYLVETRRDGASKELRATYQDDKRLRHTFYVMDERALEAKLDLVVKDHPKIAGIAIWVMGDEESGFWDVIQQTFAY